jgi:molybdopterin converting factor subunit 1
VNVTVKLFASYRERTGQRELALELPDFATVGHLAREMVRRYPRLAQDASRLVVAVNQEYREHGYVLSEGDEVALIPPVSGGAR